ncbi:MAG TPA: hypothetical protein DCQ98_02985 [Planctomycetaceae bacterium]|nr:hypothetical protein [Planctomycetaceae bacterium]
MPRFPFRPPGSSFEFAAFRIRGEAAELGESFRAGKVASGSAARRDQRERGGGDRRGSARRGAAVGRSTLDGREVPSRSADPDDRTGRWVRSRGSVPPRSVPLAEAIRDPIPAQFASVSPAAPLTV